ncbi:hypothetical protein SACE_0518 [Saccharopolyspora erythraea NRRL 2338]|uniref:Uncharacterized protein n=1 Tax=Saccharopolyspora erythraea (strain ATCC 11635 / DSM 40517 / JCM 4748 / NBRC 13426 / NCIMB 8594 / NRRL 2338) TaxID=405948 RepID=A4F740_SACEN|nr:hypothetical protein [Saccharopolyspora erythraea]QRK90514.1 hypothetical protein JQX30_03140 [Saccharopolyspora erythraea]CAL99864.1 hypothetical protein SACE_0518 [Saccharopolyspora erythraea NRRL 2338]
MAAVPSVAGRIAGAVAERAEDRLARSLWRSHLVLEGAGFAALYVGRGGQVGVRRGTWLVERLSGFWGVSLLALVPLCGLFGRIAVRSIGRERLRRALGWGVPLLLTAILPVFGDWLLDTYLSPFALDSTDVKAGLTDSVHRVDTPTAAMRCGTRWPSGRAA